ncbi:hypothetical protein [Lichenifustis flavocetrariae]|uniref:Uncharacterized protein n=1 Tax=Lichenifustis flavocetrariae TaxID=2949735 RepID=A0AA41Z0B9_9HYPH|nr:hypothetical protein [Lichenifustis flavocetrariae]MCW6508198.1 hypothetical protein [Lichenifustis flavocetrariae]
MARPDDPWAVKVGFDGEDGWPAWAAWCSAHPGLHVPVVHSCQLFAHAGHYEGFVAIVERLWPTDLARPWLADGHGLKREPLRLADLVSANHPGVAAMLRAAAEAFPTGRWDMAPSNWMRRADGVPVLMDPLTRAD